MLHEYHPVIRVSKKTVPPAGLQCSAKEKKIKSKKGNASLAKNTRPKKPDKKEM